MSKNCIYIYLHLQPSLQWSKYAYKDQAREKQRLAEIESRSSNVASEREKSAQEKATREERAKRNSAWSGKATQKEIRELRRAKKAKKQEWVKKQAASAKNEDQVKHEGRGGASDESVDSDDASSISPKGKSVQSGDEEQDDWAEYTKERKQMKKAMQASAFTGL